MRTRDVDALAFIGRGYEVGQYQLHEAVFGARVPTVVSRFVVRTSRRGLIAADRLSGIGMNRLRLTRLGRDFLIDRGVPADELFAPAKPVALKDLAHTLAINDLAVAVSGLRPAPASAWPAWYLQRRLRLASAIPDLLVRWSAAHSGEGLLLACEIDLGGERLEGVFCPKLERLAMLLDEAAEGSRAAIAVFTRGKRRLEVLERHVREAQIPVMLFTLPETAGSREGIRAFRSLLASD